MTRTKKTALLVSALAIVLCAAVIVGATYALFTDGEEYAIGVNTGKIDVSGTLTLKSAWSEAQTTGVRDEETISGDSVTVAQGGTVTVSEGNTVKFANMSLGDGAKLQIAFTNNSTIDMKYRVTLSVKSDGAASDFLKSSLTVKTSGEAAPAFGEDSDVCVITDWTSVTAGSSISNTAFEVALPWSALAASESIDEAQSIDLLVKMEAVQDNAYIPQTIDVENEYSGNLVNALRACNSGDTILLPSGTLSWTEECNQAIADKTDLKLVGKADGSTKFGSQDFAEISGKGSLLLSNISLEI